MRCTNHKSESRLSNLKSPISPNSECRMSNAEWDGARPFLSAAAHQSLHKSEIRNQKSEILCRNDGWTPIDTDERGQISVHQCSSVDKKLIHVTNRST